MGCRCLDYQTVTFGRIGESTQGATTRNSAFGFRPSFGVPSSEVPVPKEDRISGFGFCAPSPSWVTSPIKIGSPPHCEDSLHEALSRQHEALWFCAGHDGLKNANQSNDTLKENVQMKNTNRLAKQAALAAVLALTGTALLNAQTNQAPIGQPESGLSRQPATTIADPGITGQASTLMKINKGSSLIGTTVKNQQGDELGKIRDLVIDFSADRVAYVVLDSAPGLLSSPKLHAVPLRAFQPDATGTSLILNADKDKLARAEGFDKNNWPAMTQAAWGAEPFWKDAQATSTSPEATDAEARTIKAQQDKQYKDFKDGAIEPKKTETQPKPQP